MWMYSSPEAKNNITETKLLIQLKNIVLASILSDWEFYMGIYVVDKKWTSFAFEFNRHFSDDSIVVNQNEQQGRIPWIKSSNIRILKCTHAHTHSHRHHRQGHVGTSEVIEREEKCYDTDKIQRENLGADNWKFKSASRQRYIIINITAGTEIESNTQFSGIGVEQKTTKARNIKILNL